MRAREMPLNLDVTCILHIVIQKIKDLLKVLYFYLNPSDYPPKFLRLLDSWHAERRYNKIKRAHIRGYAKKREVT